MSLDPNRALRDVKREITERPVIIFPALMSLTQEGVGHGFDCLAYRMRLAFDVRATLDRIKNLYPLVR
jgi:hypothetical protein